MRGNRPFFTTRVYTSATIETTEIYIRKSFFFFLFFSRICRYSNRSSLYLVEYIPQPADCWKKTIVKNWINCTIKNTLRGEYRVMKEDCEQYFIEILERLFENWGGLKILHLYVCTQILKLCTWVHPVGKWPNKTTSSVTCFFDTDAVWQTTDPRDLVILLRKEKISICRGVLVYR